MIRSAIFGLRRFTFTAAKVAATATAAAAVAARYYSAEREQCLAPTGSDDKIGINVLFPELFGDVETERSVIIVYVAFGEIREDRVRSVDLLELVRCLWIVRILVRVIPERQFSISFLDLVRGSGLLNFQSLVEGVPRS